MDVKLDYLSFTIMEDVRQGSDNPDQWQRLAVGALWDNQPATAAFFEQVGNWQSGGARGHYSASLYQPQIYAAMRFGGSANHILVELPGTACQRARDNGLLDQIVAQASERLTRLDIACDIPDGCSPAAFVGAGYNARFEAHASLISPSGETEYVGSMKSERFSRVYRYAATHPRAGTLRVEYVLRSSYAKTAAHELSKSGLSALACACGNTFGWQSSYWQPSQMTEAKLRSQRSDRHEPSRVRWLNGVCVPSLLKAHHEGLIDLAEVIRLFAKEIAKEE